MIHVCVDIYTYIYINIYISIYTYVCTHTHAQRTPGGYAISGQDSDFFIMSGIRYLPLEYLKIEGVGNAIQVTGRIFTSELVAAALNIPQFRMHELAWYR